MGLQVGIDVGGTFTDFLVTGHSEEAKVFKVLSTPQDPSIGLINGLNEIAVSFGMTLAELASSIDTMVHGTTVTTNALLTLSGAKTALLTTEGVRDALEMRRGIREEQYNNRYTNVQPLVPRYLRLPIKERLNYQGDELEPLNLLDVQKAIKVCQSENIEAVAICFMNSFANPGHEKAAAELVRRELPNAYLTVSAELLPSIRFYERVSTTTLNSYMGPKLANYLQQLTGRLKEIGFSGVLLIMQSNGGVMSPETARQSPARTLLSGPAAGPGAGLSYARIHGYDSCITVDMGGTSFDAALVQNGCPMVVCEGEIDRYRIALPMLDIVTIGSGGGSIAWIDDGGLLRLGPQSAGADPGPASYGKGGQEPTCTDANLVLGYLDPSFFAGGKIALNLNAATKAIEQKIAQPLGLSIEEAAAGMYRVINTNMAQGVRQVSIKRGYDPREFPMVVAGGAGPLHACMICEELEIPTFIVPRDSSIFCAAGMLLSDLQHDFVRSFVTSFNQLDWQHLQRLISEMRHAGSDLLKQEKIPPEQQRYTLVLDCRYAKQYHEVSLPVELSAVDNRDLSTIAAAFHAEHNRLYGYSLENDATSIELINVRLRAVGVTSKPTFFAAGEANDDPLPALKNERSIYLPQEKKFVSVPVYDGHKTSHGNKINGPAIIEQVNTTLLLTSSYSCLCDKYGNFVVTAKEGN